MALNLRSVVSQSRRNEFAWRYGFNFLPTLGYQFLRRPTGLESTILKQLDTNGIAITSVEKCPNVLVGFNELDRSVNCLLESSKDELNRLRAKSRSSASIGEKTFNVELLPSPIKFNDRSVYARFALQHFIRNVANGYFRMIAELRYYNVWNTFATSGEFRESQLWHFDREDNYILKVFVYLRNVDEGCGPFTYAPGTHRKGPLWNRQPEYFFEKNVKRSTDEQMAKIVPSSDWIRATGKKGTIVFADTRGFHKGGEARTHDRLMYTCMYTSPSSQSKRLIEYPAV